MREAPVSGARETPNKLAKDEKPIIFGDNRLTKAAARVILPRVAPSFRAKPRGNKESGPDPLTDDPLDFTDRRPDTAPSMGRAWRMDDVFEHMAAARRLAPAIGAEAFLEGLFGVFQVGEFIEDTVLRPAGDRQQLAGADHAQGRSNLEGAVHTMNRESVTVGTIATGCELGWLGFINPDYDWRAARRALAQWYAEFSQCPSVAETAPKQE